MSSTNFIDKSTVIEADWLNEVDAVVHDVFDGASTKAEARTALNVEDDADVTDAENVGSSIHGATAKATPVDADTVPLIDSAASNVLKKVTWANVKATLKTYFDTLYVALTGNQTVAGVKTFSSFPVTPSSAPTTDYQVANKKYVDDKASLTYTEITTATNLAVGNAYYAKNTAATHTLPELSGLTDGNEIFLSISGGDAIVTVSQHANDSNAAHWIGCAEGDFVHLIVVDGAWHVRDHKNSHYVYLRLAADQNIAQGAGAKVTGWTEITDRGGLWDASTNHQLDIPSSIDATLDIALKMVGNIDIVATAKIDSSYLHDASDQFATNPSNPLAFFGGKYDISGGSKLELWAQNMDNDDGNAPVRGDATKIESFATIKIDWRY